MIPVGRLAPAGCWDTNLLERLFRNELYPTGLQFKIMDGYPNTNDSCVLVVPCRYWYEHIDEINAAIRRYSGVLFIRVGDEEDMFDVNRLEHPNIRYWIQTPRTDRHYPYGSRFFGVGFPPHFNNLSSTPPDKDMDVFLSAQRTHLRRQQAFEALEHVQGSQFVKSTDGFTKSWREGVGPGDYAVQMMKAKVAPAPSGAVSPDSFRLYEALEAHSVPIADDVSPAYDSEGYWRTLFPAAPFPILTDYADLPGYINDQLEVWPANANRIAAWWMRQKREMVLWLEADLKALGAL
jgi:hypothetical protein